MRLSSPLFCRQLCAVTVLVGYLLTATGGTTALADGLIRLEPYPAAASSSGTPGIQPMASSFYQDPYTESLLKGNQPAAPAATTAPATTNSGVSSASAATTPYTPAPYVYTSSGYNVPDSASSGAAPYSSPSYTASNSGSYAPLQANLTYIPAGESFTIQLNDYVSTQTARVGDPVSATVAAPIVVNGVEVVPAGSQVDGSVTYVSPAGRIGKHGEMEVRFYSVNKPNGERISINGYIVTDQSRKVDKNRKPEEAGILKGDTYTMDVLKGVGIAAGSTALGAVAGTAVGGLLEVAGTGAAVGTAIGGAAGIGIAMARKGKSVDLPKGTRLLVKLDNPATVPAR